MRSIIQIFFFLPPSFGHAGIFDSLLDKFRADPPEIRVSRAFDERGLRLAEPIEMLVRRGDRLEFGVFEGPAATLIKEANRDARVAETIRGVNYYDQRGLDATYDGRAAVARERALAAVHRFDIVAGRDVKLIALKRLLEAARRYWTPRDVIWSREYFVPKVIWLEPVDPARPRKSDCTTALESEEMLAEERQLMRRSREN